MVRRYDLTRSDNAPFTGRKAYATYGTTEGYIFINTRFKVSHAIISWSSIYADLIEESTSSDSTEINSTSSLSSSSTEANSTSSSSSSSTKQSLTSSSSSNSSSSTQAELSLSSSSTGQSLTSSSSSDSSEIKSSSSSSSSSSSEEWLGPFIYPRIYVYSYQDTGFTVRYENIPINAKYIEFEFSAL